jgi:hypothetical protein
MLETARAIILTSVPSDLSPYEQRRFLFRRLYPEPPLRALPHEIR